MHIIVHYHEQKRNNMYIKREIFYLKFCGNMPHIQKEIKIPTNNYSKHIINI